MGYNYRKPLALFFAIAVLTINILLSITDQVGLVDLLTMLLDIGLLLLLVIKRSVFLFNQA
jgi:hypothetical protein